MNILILKFFFLMCALSGSLYCGVGTQHASDYLELEQKQDPDIKRSKEQELADRQMQENITRANAQANRAAVQQGASQKSQRSQRSQSRH